MRHAAARTKTQVPRTRYFFFGIWLLELGTLERSGVTETREYGVGRIA